MVRALTWKLSKGESGMESLTIGKVARRAGVNIETLRYYERQGIIPRPSRTMSNYRVYSEDTVRRVRFVKRAQELGFSLKEIKELLSLRATRGMDCDAVRYRALAKIEGIDEKIRALEAMRGVLGKLVEECSVTKGPLTQCPILESLDSDGER